MLRFTDKEAQKKICHRLLESIRELKQCTEFAGYEKEFALLRDLYFATHAEEIDKNKHDYETIDSLMELCLTYPTYETWAEGLCQDCLENLDEEEDDNRCECAMSHPLHDLIASAHFHLQMSRKLNEVTDQSSDEDLI